MYTHYHWKFLMAEQPQKLPIRKFPILGVQVIANEGYWERSEFPHPLVTLDYDAQGNLLAVKVLGNDLRVELNDSDPLSVAILKGNPELDREKYIADYEAAKQKEKS